MTPTVAMMELFLALIVTSAFALVVFHLYALKIRCNSTGDEASICKIVQAACRRMHGNPKVP